MLTDLYIYDISQPLCYFTSSKNITLVQLYMTSEIATEMQTEK